MSKELKELEALEFLKQQAMAFEHSELAIKVANENYTIVKQALIKAQEQEKENIEYKQLEEQIDCLLKEIIEFIKLLKKYYYVDITGQLVARTIWNNAELNEEELYKINHIFNKIKDKSE